ncbi:hypothetical protein PROFUN_10397 [Planoprotostelium fungivorum]|uniref:Uncharacterized protein n=1 Tax=Planoprotostelium fungivorum TaxID=1890364 RepID=A0A2P6NE00_9EUKA|nr:hypothetical protein PROFUN_10397 [Planoprotostelium fungivorum]
MLLAQIWSIRGFENTTEEPFRNLASHPNSFTKLKTPYTLTLSIPPPRSRI